MLCLPLTDHQHFIIFFRLGFRLRDYVQKGVDDGGARVRSLRRGRLLRSTTRSSQIAFILHNIIFMLGLRLQVPTGQVPTGGGHCAWLWCQRRSSFRRKRRKRRATKYLYGTRSYSKTRHTAKPNVVSEPHFAVSLQHFRFCYSNCCSKTYSKTLQKPSSVSTYHSEYIIMSCFQKNNDLMMWVSEWVPLCPLIVRKKLERYRALQYKKNQRASSQFPDST